jgi:hypothetical protein
MANNTVLYGFVGLEYLFSEKLEDVNVATVQTAIQVTLEEHNRQIAAATGDMFGFTEEYKVRFQQPGGGTLQPLDEWGVPLPTRPAGYYDVAFPIRSAGDSFGANRIAGALQTVADVNRHLADVLMRDANWIRRHMLAALLDNTTWSFDDPQHGTLTIQPLANGDSVTYPKRSGTMAVDTHHLAQAATVADATNPFPTIFSDLSEHPVNANAPIVAYIPSNLRSAVTGLATFVDVGDPDIMLGSTSSTLSGRIDRGWGDEVLGKTDKVWVVESGILPDNYIVANARGAAAPPLWAREYPAASLKGLQRKQHDVNGNIMQTMFFRDLGFGVYNRVGAMVYFVAAGDTTYDIPTGYTNPLAV